MMDRAVNGATLHRRYNFFRKMSSPIDITELSLLLLMRQETRSQQAESKWKSNFPLRVIVICGDLDLVVVHLLVAVMEKECSAPYTARAALARPAVVCCCLLSLSTAWGVSAFSFMATTASSHGSSSRIGVQSTRKRSLGDCGLVPSTKAIHFVSPRITSPLDQVLSHPV